jgi:hypothetical protein
MTFKDNTINLSIEELSEVHNTAELERHVRDYCPWPYLFCLFISDEEKGF